MNSLVLAAPPAAAGGRRHLRSLTAGVEKRILVWMAARLPSSINPDHLTLLGLASALGIGVAFALTAAWPAAPLLVVPLLVLNWLGDSLDGTLARVREQQRPRYGFYVDHVVDVAGMTAIGAGLSASGLMAPPLGLAVALAYVLLAAESFLATHTTGTFRMSWGPFGPTELRIVLAAGAVKAALSPCVTVAGVEMRLFDLGGAIAVAGMVTVFVVAAATNTRLLFEAEPVRRRSGDAR
jgi:archaetidylinositol phosphate synthase